MELARCLILLGLSLSVAIALHTTPPAWPPPMPPLLPISFFAEVTGFQTGEAGNVVFFNESTAGKNVTLEGAWHYDFSSNRMRADYAESVDGVFMRDLTEYWEGNGLPGKDGRMVTVIFSCVLLLSFDLSFLSTESCFVPLDGESEMLSIKCCFYINYPLSL